MFARLEAAFLVTSASEEHLDAHLDAVLGVLNESVGVIDPDITASLAEGTVAITLIVGDDQMSSLAGIQEFGLAAVRSAIHAAGGFTSKWPTVDEAFPDFEASACQGEWTEERYSIETAQVA